MLGMGMLSEYSYENEAAALAKVREDLNDGWEVLLADEPLAGRLGYLCWKMEGEEEVSRYHSWLIYPEMQNVFVEQVDASTYLAELEREDIFLADDPKALLLGLGRLDGTTLWIRQIPLRSVKTFAERGSIMALRDAHQLAQQAKVNQRLASIRA